MNGSLARSAFSIVIIFFPHVTHSIRTQTESRQKSKFYTNRKQKSIKNQQRSSHFNKKKVRIESYVIECEHQPFSMSSGGPPTDWLIRGSVTVK